VKRLVLAALVCALACLALPVAATAIPAEPCPPFDGLMAFPDIHSLEDPENYCWEVKLGEEEELRQIDETHAGVFYEDGHRAMLIEAPLAHDADGASVPTTLSVAEPTLVTLTVHHRAGNPAAGGAPFDYPVVQGVGWEGGFHTYEVQMPPPTEQASPPVAEPPAPTCTVPVLHGRTVKAARKALLLRGCTLGPVRGPRRLGARIVKQYRPAFTVLPAGTAVGVKLPR
jgi:hypothetical protein